MLHRNMKIRFLLILQLCIFLILSTSCGSAGPAGTGFDKSSPAATAQASNTPSNSPEQAGSSDPAKQTPTAQPAEPAASQGSNVQTTPAASENSENPASQPSPENSTTSPTTQPSTQPAPASEQPSQKPDEVKNVIYSTMPLGRDIMPIGAWVAPPPANALPKMNNPDYINTDTYRDIKESGINIIYGLYETFPDRRSDINRALDAAEANGIKYLARDYNIMGGIDDIDMLKSAVEAYKDHPAFAGHNIQDEPGMNSFENYKYLHENYQKVLPDKLFYINLLPTYSTAAQRERGAAASGSGKATYSDYLNSYIEQVEPKVLSYDYYPLSGSFPKLESDYFNNMSMIRKKSMETGAPFWVFIQSCSFGGGTRSPKEAEIQWQVNTALAYGAKGIQYFTYWTPLEFETTQGGMVTKTGEKTDIYYYVQRMNKQIAAMDKILMNAENQGVIVHKEAGPVIPKGDRLTAYQELAGVEGDTPAIIGCFKYNGRSVFYVVNNTINQDGPITLKFNRNISMNIIEDVKPVQNSGDSITLSLKAGSGALIEVQ